MTCKIAAAVISAVAVSGCGMMIDTAYLLSDRKSREVVKESAPTQHSVERLECGVTITGKDAFALECAHRTRTLERVSSTQKTYRYQGGFSRLAYGSAIAGDLFIGGTAAFVVGVNCRAEDTDFSCLNLLYLSPFAIDLVYSLVRNLTVKPKVLVGKEPFGPDTIEPSPSALAERPAAAGDVAAVWLARSPRTSFATGLSSTARAEFGANAQLIVEGGGPETIFFLSSEAVEYWLSDRSASLWVVDRRGEATQLAAGRCEILRFSTIPQRLTSKFVKACSNSSASQTK